MAKERVRVSSDKNEPIAISDRLSKVSAEERIHTVRGTQVIVDRDLAELYGVETKAINQAVKRNPERFPNTFQFQLTEAETNELVTICDRFEPLKHSSTQPHVFTEQGVAMLSAILHSPTAVKVSVKIMDAFVAMRRFLVSNAQVFQRLDRVEYKLLESDHKFEEIYSKLEEKSLDSKPKVFFEGQVYDAYEFICKLIKSATNRIVLIDNYVDDTVLTMLDKRETGVSATIYTKVITKQLKLDIAKHNSQYPAIDVKIFTDSHDRFLIVDERIYLVGASIKDLGKKWFGIAPMPETNADELISRLLKDSLGLLR